ncbi:MAG: energy transducer TonB [Flavobacteriales bacterium]|nr:energy transducer TonB [Flavobacteriales bacterium]MCB9181857.1 energy transducer TonB [Flavobacteriales bacterium]MCB9200642.1 energy transducer TonB [Flavobacteriales bacterium]HOP42347.1 energy transducer TonB [Flavobacteriales bacterium]HPF66304.1 energy transducer TonB [Flavobacteriales bacterium]
MEARKNPEADIERRKGSFMLLGLLTAVAITLVALEWTVFDKTDSEMATLDLEFLEEEVIPPSATPPPPPPPPPAPTTVLEIVEDDEDIEEVEIEDTEVEEDFEVEIIEEPEEEVVEEQIFTIVEEMPSFPGGEEELFKYLGKSIKYPQMAADAGISGVVYVTFVVDKDGKVKDAKVLRGIGGGCDEEAIRVVKAMPPWKPGKQRGKAVKVQYNLPIRFTLK